MSAQAKLFTLPTRRRVLLHVADRGCDDRVRLYCYRCGHDTGWIVVTKAQIRCGIPCPVCNKGSSGHPSGEPAAEHNRK